MARAYVEAQGVEEALCAALTEVMKEKPENALASLVGKLSAKVNAEKPAMCAFLTVDKSKTVQEYTDVFWRHAYYKKLYSGGKSFTLEMTRSEFCDESKTRVFSNVKAEKELILCCSAVDMAVMGAMMGGPAFIEMGKGLWDMDPATGLKIRAAAPPGAKADVIAFLTLKDGVTVADYEAVFGQHADSKTVAYKGKSYEVPATRRAFCAEERTRIYVDTKEDSDLAVCLYDVDVALMGEVMGAAGFVAIGSLMWDLTAVEFMVPPPPPPGA